MSGFFGCGMMARFRNRGRDASKAPPAMEGPMSNHMTYGGAILLAGLLVGIAVTGSPVRAQTAPAAADECLAKPNGP